MEFRLLRVSPLERMTERISVAVLVVVLPVNLVLFAVGKMDWDVAWQTAAGFILLAAAAVWLYPVLNSGVAVLDASHLIVKRRIRTEVYRWEHVAQVRVTTLRERGEPGLLVVAIFGFDPDEPFVEVQLTRSIREGISPTKSGTDVLGLPTLIKKRTHVYVKDPEGFVREAQQCLARARPSRPES